MKMHRTFIAPVAGIVVGVAAAAAFGAAFGILVGLGLATITVVTGGLILSADAGIKAANGSTSTPPGIPMRV